MGMLWKQADGWRHEQLPAGGAFEQRLATNLLLVPLGSARGDAALLLLGDDAVSVSGRPVLGRLAILRHRDEIILADSRWWYSAEGVPEIKPFVLAAGRQRPKCAVCRNLLEDGQMTVACPGCSLVYHYVDALGDQAAKHCYTYRSHCSNCQHPTSLSGEPSWRPEADEDSLLAGGDHAR